MSRSWTQSLIALSLWPARALAARRDLAMLAALDDHGLSDIGLTRQDLRDATGYGALDDPMERLAERARERAALALARRVAPEPPAPPAMSRTAPRDRAA